MLRLSVILVLLSGFSLSGHALDYIDSDNFHEPRRNVAPGAVSAPPERAFQMGEAKPTSLRPELQAAEITAVVKRSAEDDDGDTLMVRDLTIDNVKDIRAARKEPNRPQIGAVVGIDAGEESRTIIIDNVTVNNIGADIESPDLSAVVGIRACQPSKIIINNLTVRNHEGHIRAYSGVTDSTRAALVGIDSCGRSGSRVIVRGIRAESHGGSISSHTQQ